MLKFFKLNRVVAKNTFVVNLNPFEDYTSAQIFYGKTWWNFIYLLKFLYDRSVPNIFRQNNFRKQVNNIIKKLTTNLLLLTSLLSYIDSKRNRAEIKGIKTSGLKPRILWTVNAQTKYGFFYVNTICLISLWVMYPSETFYSDTFRLCTLNQHLYHTNYWCCLLSLICAPEKATLACKSRTA